MLNVLLILAVAGEAENQVHAAVGLPAKAGYLVLEPTRRRA